MPRVRWIILIALGVVVLLAGTFFIRSTVIYNAQVIVKEKGSPIGINPMEDRVDFGDVPQGSGVSKTLIFENEGSVPNRLIIYVLGSIGDMVQTEPQSFILKPGEKKDVKLRLVMPESAPVDKVYTGRVIVLRLPLGIF